MKENGFVEDVKKMFSDNFRQSDIFVFESIDSTNNFAKEYAKKAVSKKSAFFIAEKQTFGRGSKGRSFLSEKGGLYITFLFYPGLAAKDAVMLTVFAAVALVETIRDFTGIDPKIKWVNDAYIGNKKIAGILTEGAFSDGGKGFDYAIVGIGVNVKKQKFGEELANIASDIESETGVSLDIPSFALAFAKRLSLFEESDIYEYMEKYKSYSFVVGKKIRVTTGEKTRYGKAVYINDDGSLRVLFDDGEEKDLISADVSVMPV